MYVYTLTNNRVPIIMRVTTWREFLAMAPFCVQTGHDNTVWEVHDNFRIVDCYSKTRH